MDSEILSSRFSEGYSSINLLLRFLCCVCLHCLGNWLPVLALRVYLVACACPAYNWLLVLVLPA